MSHRTLPVTHAERACATVLRVYLAWNFDAREPISKEYGSMLRLCDFLATEGLVIEDEGSPALAGQDLLARVEAAERTPAAVLRAMLRAYEDDALELEIRLRRFGANKGPWTWADRSARNARREQVPDLRAITAAVLAGEPFDAATAFGANIETTIGLDYAARLAGTTPIDAPPRREP